MFNIKYVLPVDLVLIAGLEIIRGQNAIRQQFRMLLKLCYLRFIVREIFMDV